MVALVYEQDQILFGEEKRRITVAMLQCLYRSGLPDRERKECQKGGVSGAVKAPGK